MERQDEKQKSSMKTKSFTQGDLYVALKPRSVRERKCVLREEERERENVCSL